MALKKSPFRVKRNGCPSFFVFAWKCTRNGFKNRKGNILCVCVCVCVCVDCLLPSHPQQQLGQVETSVSVPRLKRQ